MTDLGWVSDLLDNFVNLVNSELNDTLIHPLRFLELLDEGFLDIGNNLVTKDFGLLRESFFYKESTQNPAKTIIDMVYACPPSLGR